MMTVFKQNNSATVRILSIGNELLNGSTINTNLSFLGRKLQEFGIEPEIQITIPDEHNSIISALKSLCNKPGLVISTGGLGPTSDDITKSSIASFFGLSISRSKLIEDKIRRFWLKRGRKEIPESVFSQADVISGAEIIPNNVGTAPGFIIEDKKKSLFMLLLPGPPAEALPMLDAKIANLIKKSGLKKISCKKLLSSGLPESIVEELTKSVLKDFPQIIPAYCASAEEVRIYLKSPDSKAVKNAAAKLELLLGDNFIRPPHENIYAELISLLAEKKESLAIAESCTGGLLSKRFTDQPGASKAFTGSIISYANEIKIEKLGVKSETIKKFGAVSEQCAAEMLSGIKKSFNANAAISITGIAGPDGGSKAKPVGLVFIGTAYNKSCEIRKYLFNGSRQIIRERAAASAAKQLKKIILSNDG